MYGLLTVYGLLSAIDNFHHYVNFITGALQSREPFNQGISEKIYYLDIFDGSVCNIPAIGVYKWVDWFPSAIQAQSREIYILGGCITCNSIVLVLDLSCNH